MSDIKQGKGKLKVKKAKQDQGETPKTGNLGIGDAFAMAVKGLTDRAAGMKGKGFLGVADKLLNPMNYIDREKLHGKKKEK